MSPGVTGRAAGRADGQDEIRVELTLPDGREIWAQVTRDEAQELELHEGQILTVRLPQPRELGEQRALDDRLSGTDHDQEHAGDAPQLRQPPRVLPVAEVGVAGWREVVNALRRGKTGDLPVDLRP